MKTALDSRLDRALIMAALITTLLFCTAPIVNADNITILQSPGRGTMIDSAYIISGITDGSLGDSITMSVLYDGTAISEAEIIAVHAGAFQKQWHTGGLQAGTYTLEFSYKSASAAVEIYLNSIDDITALHALNDAEEIIKRAAREDGMHSPEAGELLNTSKTHFDDAYMEYVLGHYDTAYNKAVEAQDNAMQAYHAELECRDAENLNFMLTAGGAVSVVVIAGFIALTFRRKKP